MCQSAQNKVEFMTATAILTYLNEKNRSNIRLTNINVGKSLKMLGFPRDTHYESEQQKLAQEVNMNDRETTMAANPEING